MIYSTVQQKVQSYMAQVMCTPCTVAICLSTFYDYLCLCVVSVCIPARIVEHFGVVGLTVITRYCLLVICKICVPKCLVAMQRRTSTRIYWSSLRKTTWCQKRGGPPIDTFSDDYCNVVFVLFSSLNHYRLYNNTDRFLTTPTFISLTGLQTRHS